MRDTHPTYKIIVIRRGGNKWLDSSPSDELIQVNSRSITVNEQVNGTVKKGTENCIWGHRDMRHVIKTGF